MSSVVRTGATFAGYNGGTSLPEFYLGGTDATHIKYSANQLWRLELTRVAASVFAENNTTPEAVIQLDGYLAPGNGSISDDGNYIAIRLGSSTNRVIHVPTGDVIFSVSLNSAVCEIHPFAPYIALNSGRTPYVYNYSTGAAENVPMPTDGYYLRTITHAQFSPNGDMLLFWGNAYWWWNELKNPILIQRHMVVPGGTWTRSGTTSTWTVVADGQSYGDFSWSPRWNNIGVLRAIGYPYLYVKDVSSGSTRSSSPLQNTEATVTGMAYTHDGLYFIVTYNDATAEVFQEIDVAGILILSPVYYGPWSGPAVSPRACSGAIPAYITGEVLDEAGAHVANNKIHVAFNEGFQTAQADSPFQLEYFGAPATAQVVVEYQGTEKNHYITTINTQQHLVVSWAEEPEYTPRADNYALYSWVTKYLRPVRIDTPPIYEFVGGSSVAGTVGSDPNDDNTYMDFLTGGVVWYYLQPPPGLPSADNAMQIQYRVAAEDVVDLQVSLVQGQATRVIRDWVRVPTTPTVYSHQLTQLEKASITRWDNLYLKMEFRLGDPNN